MKNIEIIVSGLVQGVGFRPYIYNLALRYNLNGYVKNINSSLYIFIQSDDEKALNNFISYLKFHPPKNAKIKSIQTKIIKHSDIYTNFHIESSSIEKFSLDSTLPLDLAICKDCLREMNDKNNRRFHYGFINCINCGPRYSIIKSLPYDRERTAMSDFVMCEDCKNEYSNISDRRFHAQPNSCHKCGISLTLYKASNMLEPIKSKDSIAYARKLLCSDKILAIKGIGGFNIVCSVKQNLIAKLRTRKRRPTKPFAIMFRDISHLKRYFILTAKQEELLCQKSAPIVLLDKKNARLKIKFPANLASNIRTIGVILAYSPLHRLLFKDRKMPLIFTSANLSGEPLVSSKEEAFSKLSGIFEYLLDYNRDIINPIDDSLMCVLKDNTSLILRHARGLAPLNISIKLESKKNLESKTILALGANQKSQITLYYNGNAVISPYIGDLDNIDSIKRFKQNIKLLLEIFGLKPNIIVCDMHEDYNSTKIARELSKELRIELFGVYHHKAHFYSAMLDNNLSSKRDYLAMVFDGTGLGSDRCIWGGEIFLYKNRQDFALSRILHFKYIPLLGGEAAIKDIERLFVGLVFSVYKEDSINMLKKANIKHLYILFDMFKKNINCPLSSSVGRLFDCIAYMCGLKTQSYEGESGMYVESLCKKNILQFYSYSIIDDEIVIDWKEVFIEYGLVESKNKIDKSLIATKFINTLARIITDVALRYRLPVVFSGGVFQNKILCDRIITLFKSNKLIYHFPKNVSPNDGGIALGQVGAYLHNDCIRLLV